MSHATLEPIQLGSVRLRNRVAFSASVNNLGHNTEITDEQIQFYAARSFGGVGAIITEGLSVHRTSLPNGTVPLAFEKAMVPGFSRLADEVHRGGAVIFGQLWHVGRQALWNPSLTPWSVSGDRDSYSGATPHVMSDEEIEEVIEGFVQSARNLAEAGFDGAELHGAHGYLITQFLSPASNHRTDQWGGSTENRTRFVARIINAIRAATGPDFVVGLKLAAHEYVEGGIDLEESQAITRQLASDARPSYIATGQGNFSPSLEKHVPDLHFKDAPFAELTAGIRSVADGIPVMAVSKIPDVATADGLLASGAADMVGMSRALIADAELVNKTSAGLRPRPCVYCNVCWAYIHTGRAVACIYAPSSGQEAHRRDLHDLASRKSRSVQVVGGGPAGMEFARVAAELGHRVRIDERSDRLGGRMITEATAPGREEFQAGIDWFREELERLGVDIHLNSEVDLTAFDGAVDHVAVATGAQPTVAGLPGLAHAVSLEQALTDASTLSGPIVIVDEIEDEPVYAVAERLVATGHRVSRATRRASIGRRLAYVNLIGALRRLDLAGVDIHSMVVPGRMQDGSLVLRHALSDREYVLGPVETLVYAGPYQAPDLAELPSNAVVIGDASAPREMLAVVREANDVATSVLA